MQTVIINNYLLIIILALLLVIIISIRQKRYRSRHYRNKKSAKRTLAKIRNKARPFTEGQTMNYLRKIDPFVFEELLLYCFQEQGYRIKRNKRYTGDGGIDGTIFNRNGDKILIQAKRYSSYVNPSHITDFLNAINRSRAVGGYFVHTGKTGAKSYENISPKVFIISGNRLLQMIMTMPVHDEQRFLIKDYMFRLSSGS